MREDRSPPQADRGRHVVRGIGSLTIQSVLNAVLGFGEGDQSTGLSSKLSWLIVQLSPC